MKMRTNKKFVPEGIELSKVKYDDSWNEDIVETAGFIPLEVRFKQMEQAGFRARFFQSEFSSKDVSDMYLNHPEFDITDEDDMEEALEKIQLRQAYIESVKNEVRKRNFEAQQAQIESESKAKANTKAPVSEGKNVKDEENGI